MASRNAKPDSLPVRWAPEVAAAYFDSLNYIAAQDQHSADLVVQRVERALAVIQSQPDIGTLARRGVRRFSIPKTGHVIEYRVTGTEIRVIRWARQRRK